jgi:hypothetical protein
MDNLFARVAGVHGRVATDVWPNGVALRCTVCDHRETHDAAAAGRFLAHGWPTHCGQTMTVQSSTPETPEA